MTITPAITIWQPWASLITAGAKPLEFRSWPAQRAYIGKRIAIHAGARVATKDEIRALILRLRSPDWRETGLLRDLALPLLERALGNPAGMTHGAIMCTAVLGKPIRNADIERLLGLAVTNDSDRGEHSNWGWPLTDIRTLAPPMPCKGAQGFWQCSLPAELTDR
jgi:hypothetical protein